MDQGWSWVVAMSACFSSLVLAGIFRTSGVLFVAFIEHFGVTREQSAWPMAVCISVLNLTGPFSGVLAQRFGVRPVTICGAIVGAVGMSACFFTTSLHVITVLFGGVFGIGYGLVSTLLPVIVNSYFDRLRSTANGIANSGSCVGSLILPAMFEFLIQHYGLSGCFLLTGGFVLQVAVFGSLFRPPPKAFISPRETKSLLETQYLISDDSSDSGSSNDRNRFGSSCSSEVPLCDVDRYQKDAENFMLCSTADTAFSEANFGSFFYSDFSTNAVWPVKEDCSNSSGVERTVVNKSSQKGDKDLFYEVSKRENEVRIGDSHRSVDMSSSLQGNLDSMKSCVRENHSSSVPSFQKLPIKFTSGIPNSGPLRKFGVQPTISQDSINPSELVPVREDEVLRSFSNVVANSTADDLSNGMSTSHCFTVSCDERSSAFKLKKLPTLESAISGNSCAKRTSSRSGLPNQTSTKRNDPHCQQDTLQAFKGILTSPRFYIIAVTNVSFYFLFHMYVNIIVDYALDKGVRSSDTKYILFAFSLADMFGRLGFGWITDRNFVSRNHFVTCGMVGIGFVFFLFPHSDTYWALVGVSCCYGVLLGCTMIIFPILLVEYFGIEVNAVACGCLCFMNGFFSFTRPLVIGYFRDKIGSYENMFYLLGLISLLASCFLFLDRFFKPKKIITMNDEVTVIQEQR